ncbi:MAG: sigma-54-dependent Fis family transcriptional regulator [Ignavibacteriae bacterium]|nr:sigma-54-dependent Fis family transcriptional regulator [Ignavibacteriota bacterium]MCB9243167.1 sigma-54-dependent Fis family transcriptional regulator [Ignavibacteriales bacterium]
MAKILVVDDEVTSAAIMKKVLEQEGHEVTTVTDGKTALEKVKQYDFEVLVTDFNMPKMNGMQLTREVLELEPDLVVILITAYFSIKSVVEAIKLGAFDYLTKPINKDELVLAVNRGLEKVNLMNENLFLKSSLQKSMDKEHDDESYSTTSKEMQEILKEVKKVARSNSTILITGENGTGKEVLAKYIYKNSTRADQPFIVVNCAAIPSQLLESELFGHARGAFTGAIKDHKGYFEIANNGTLFLDEIGEVEPMLQVKLLRVLQEKEFSKVGDTKIRHTNVRIIAATNRDLKKMIEEGTFREDLYYRLNVFEFHLPALRERPEDIEFYFEKFIKEYSHNNDVKIKSISPEVKEILTHYNWPGNIRELKNIAERVSILCDDGKISPDLLPDKLKGNTQVVTVTSDYSENKDNVIRDFESKFIRKYLKLNKGNVAATAKAINFHPVSLRQKIYKLGIDPKEYKNF